MKFRILMALLRKELLLMRANPFVLRVVLAMPVMVMLVIPLVASMDVRNVSVAVVNLDHSPLAARLTAGIEAVDELNVTGVYDSYAGAIDEVERGRADVVLTIPRGFARDFSAGRMPSLDIAANGVNATKGATGASYVAGAVSSTLAAVAEAEGIVLPEDAPSMFNLFNPTLNFRNYMIPGLMVMLIIMICGFLPAMNIVGEKELGTIEAINVTPVGRFTFVLSKLIPYWVAGLIVVAEAMLIGRVVWGLAPLGSVCVLFLAAVLFILVMSGLGVAIANVSSTILQCIFVMFACIMVFQLMGGLFTPINSMPSWAQMLTLAVPPRYYIEIMRSVYLKGSSFAEIWTQFAALAAFAAGFCALAAATYRKRA